MIDHRCLDVSALCLTLHTQRVLSQVCLADSLPLASIATFGGRRSVRVQGFVLFAITIICQVWASGMSTGVLGFAGHDPSSLGQQKSPCGIAPHKGFSLYQFFYFTVYHICSVSSSIMVHYRVSTFLRVYCAFVLCVIHYIQFQKQQLSMA